MTGDYLCPFCARPVDPDGPTTARKVTGWADPVLATGEILERRALDKYAHDQCVTAAERRAAPATTTRNPTDD